MKRIAMVAALVILAAFVLAGCSSFRQRAAEIETRISAAEEKAQIAEEAAARNTGRLLELARRMDELETEIEALQSSHDEENATP